jgi:hypothetical protein
VRAELVESVDERGEVAHVGDQRRVPVKAILDEFDD